MESIAIIDQNSIDLPKLLSSEALTTVAKRRTSALIPADSHSTAIQGN
jgi:hypothetical protein